MLLNLKNLLGEQAQFDWKGKINFTFKNEEKNYH